MNIFLCLVVLSICTTLSYVLLRLSLLKPGILLALDVPNIRSLHKTPVPRGGGLIIVLILGVVCLGLGVMHADPVFSPLWIALLVTGTGVIGWLDDLKGLSVLLRLLLQVAGALILLAMIDLPQLVHVGGFEYPLNHGSALINLSVCLGLVGWIVWMTNLFNFMDGVDGLAVVQSVVAALTLALWFASKGSYIFMLVNVCLAGSVLGFGFLNWSPAKIFLGDVGSLSLGSYFALMAVIGWTHFEISIDVFVLLYGFFFFDASITLLRRVVTGQHWWEAHTGHYYQRLHRLGYNHRQVSLMSAAICLLLAGLSSGAFYTSQYEYVWSLTGLMVLGVCGIVIKMKEKRGAVANL